VTESSSPRLLTPALLAQLDRRLDEIGAPVTKRWLPGLDDREMDALSSKIGLSLSAEARTWWSWHDGVKLDRSPTFSSFGPGWDAFSLSHAVDDAIRMRQIAAATARDTPEFHNQDWPDSWIALCGNVSYTRVACDCATPEEGPSTIHYFDPAGNMEPLRPKLGSIGELVHAWIEALDDGTWRIDPGTGNFALLAPSELEAKGDDIGDLL
jgi:hypothetical protein